MTSALIAGLTAFALILPAELPDKTMVATLVLATRFRPLPVWLGVTTAFLVQCTIAVTAGGLLTLLPRRPLLAITAVIFAIGSVVMLRHASHAGEEELAEEKEYEQEVARTATRPGRRAALIAFGVLFAAEWGDLSQLVTAGLVLRTGEPIAVLVGSWAALSLVAGFAVTVGRTVVRRIPLTTVSRIAGGLLAIVAALTATEAFGFDLRV